MIYEEEKKKWVREKRESGRQNGLSKGPKAGISRMLEEV